jgi:hypothetical protein
MSLYYWGAIVRSGNFTPWEFKHLYGPFKTREEAIKVCCEAHPDEPHCMVGWGSKGPKHCTWVRNLKYKETRNV